MKPYDETLLTRIRRGEKRISVCHITRTDGVIHRFVRSAEGNPSEIDGNSYEPRLSKMNGLKEAPFSNETNRQTITISNVNADGTPGEFGLLTADALKPLLKAKVDTYEYFPSDNSFLYYYDGYLSQPQATEKEVPFTVVDASTAAGFCFAVHTVSARNGFTNPDPDEQTAPSSGDPGGVGGGTIGGGIGCFIHGTPVYADFKVIKDIEMFEKGDRILTFNPETLEKVAGTVKEVITAEKDDYLEITVGNKTLGVTREHKFFTEHRLFTPIAQIPVGTKIYDFSAERPQFARLSTVKLINKTVEVVNFECAPFPDYLPGGLGAHNLKDPIDGGDRGDDIFRIYGGSQV